MENLETPAKTKRVGSYHRSVSILHRSGFKSHSSLNFSGLLSLLLKKNSNCENENE